MNLPHDASHEALVEGVLTGDVDPDAKEVESLAGCAVCREQLERLRGMTMALRAAGDEQRAVLAEALGGGPVPGEELVAGLVRDALRGGATSRRRVWPWLAFAAALLVVAVVWSWSGGTHSGEPVRDRLLHVAKPWPTGPDIGDLAGKQFEWPGDPDEAYELLLFSGADPIRPWAVIRCDANCWPVGEDEAARLRAAGRDWTWYYERTSPQRPGSKSVSVSESYSFSFAH